MAGTNRKFITFHQHNNYTELKMSLGQKKRIAPNFFYHGCRKRQKKRLGVMQKTLLCDQSIELVLIYQQSVGKRSLHLMDTVNAKKRWTIIYWRVNKFLKESHIVTRLAEERASFLHINDISFIERLTNISVVL
jgi:hypothetical protein